MTVGELVLPEDTGLASSLGWKSVRKAEVKYLTFRGRGFVTILVYVGVDSIGT